MRTITRLQHSTQQVVILALISLPPKTNLCCGTERNGRCAEDGLAATKVPAECCFP